jgi:glycosyltransferase involved in cell wall biosynthesis
MVQGSRFVIRVGFILTFDGTTWLGGVSYFRNLLRALRDLPHPRIEPVIFCGERTEESVLAQFPAQTTVRSSLLDAGSSSWNARRISAKLCGRDLLLEGLLRRYGIQALSHQGFFGGLRRIPALGWIPDFQERHLPEFFSPTEIRARVRKRNLFCRVCPVVILSSQDARQDLEALDRRCASKAKVLHFVADATAPSEEEACATARRLGVNRPYFHLPNQFWNHKNHLLVVEALRLLQERGVKARVVATGNTSDYRQPAYFNALMQRVRDGGVEGCFTMLGTVAYEDLYALMVGSVAVINPSRFEGWSTTVEEAKSLGKMVLLSDLGVHREQAPKRSWYFSPDNAEELAAGMAATLESYDSGVDREAIREAQASLPERRRAFAMAYENIVLEAAV